MKRWNANLPALVLLFALLLVWQLGATGMDAAYILPSPTQILVRMWELREPLLTAHLPATLQMCIRDRSRRTLRVFAKI